MPAHSAFCNFLVTNHMITVCNPPFSTDQVTVLFHKTKASNQGEGIRSHHHNERNITKFKTYNFHR